MTATDTAELAARIERELRAARDSGRAEQERRHLKEPARASRCKRPGHPQGGPEAWRLASGLNREQLLSVVQARCLHGVVPEEMFACWPAAALRTQAVAARIYALTSRYPDEPFDVFADTRSQVYGRSHAEAERTTAAVRDTRRLAVLYRDAPIQALLHASSGGRTAAVEEVFA